MTNRRTFIAMLAAMTAAPQAFAAQPVVIDAYLNPG
jgi:hypothetical protein